MPKPSPTQIRSWVAKHFEFKEKVGKYGPELRICNPYDSPRDTKYRVFINLSKAKVNDFRPNHKRHVSGTFLNFVKYYRKVSFHEAVKEVMGSVRYSDPRLEDYTEFQRGQEDKPVVRVELPEGFTKLTGGSDVFTDPVRSYLHSRQIMDAQIDANGIGYSGLNVVFPYYEFGDVVYWQSRSIVNKSFLFPDESSKTEFIYGFDNLDPDYPAVVVESITNALMFDRGCAVGGAELDVKQKKRLKVAGVKDLILAFDHDNAGMEGIGKCYNELRNDFNLWYSVTDGEDDWNRIAINAGSTQAALEMLMKNLKPLTFATSIKMKRGML